MPNRKLPKNVVIMRGTARADRTNNEEPEPLPIDSMAPPRKLKPEGKAEWDRVIGFLTSNGIVGAEGLSLLCTYCQIHARIVECEKAGIPVEAALLTQYRLMASEFGLTPAGRAKLKTGNAKKEDSKEKRIFG